MKRVIVGLLTKGQVLTVGETAYQGLVIKTIQYRQNGQDKINVGTPGYRVEMADENTSLNLFVPERDTEGALFIEEKTKKGDEVEVASAD